MEDASHLNFIPFNINAAVQRKKAVSATEQILHQSAFSVFVNYSYNVIMMPDIRIKLTIMQRMQLVLTIEQFHITNRVAQVGISISLKWSQWISCRLYAFDKSWCF